MKTCPSAARRAVSLSALWFGLALALAACGTCGDGGGGANSAPVESMAELAERVEVGVDESMVAILPANPQFVVAFDVQATFELAEALSPQADRSVFQEVVQTPIQGIEDESLRAFLQRVDFEELNDFIVASYNDEPLILTQAAALRDAPADGAEPVAFDDDGDVYGLVRGDVLAFGDQSTLALLDGETFDAATWWPQGSASLDEDAVVWAHVVDEAAIAEVLEEMDLQELGAVRKLAFSFGLSGGLTAVADLDDDAFVRQQLGRAQAAVSGGIDQVRPLAPPIAQGWISYLDLVQRAAWSRVTLERNGTTSRLHVAAPTCGTPMGSFLIAAGFAAAAEQAPFVPDDATFTPVEQRIAEGCAVVPGPAANLPIARASMAQGDGVLVLYDLGAILRTGLPTLFGLLPFALHPEDVTAAFGETPMGMASWDDANGNGAVWYAEGDLMPEVAAILPSGLHGMLPIPPGGGMVNEVVEGVGYVVGTTGAQEIARREAAADSAFLALANGLPEGASIAAIVPLGVVPEEANEELDGIIDFSKMRAIAFASGPELAPQLLVLPSGDADALATHLQDAIRAAAARVDEEADSPIFGDQWADQVLEQIEIDVEGGLVRVRTSTSAIAGSFTGMAVGLGLGAAVLIPQMGNDEPGVTEFALPPEPELTPPSGTIVPPTPPSPSAGDEGKPSEAPAPGGKP